MTATDRPAPALPPALLDRACVERRAYRLPPAARERADRFTWGTLGLLFPHFAPAAQCDAGSVRAEYAALREDLAAFLAPPGAAPGAQDDIADRFTSALPHIRDVLDLDARATHEADPAARSLDEVILSYPGFQAIAAYRLAHALHQLGVALLPRLITEAAHRQTGIDIHPGATIGPRLAIDHGTGIVIGETAVIGQRVRLYQGVTLGALRVRKDLASTRRHPTLEDDVTVYANATILGGETTIGAGSIIGGNVWLTHSVPPRSIVTHGAAVERQADGDDGLEFHI